MSNNFKKSMLSKITTINYAERIDKITKIKKYYSNINLKIIKNALFYKNLSFDFLKSIDNKNIFFNSSSSTIIKHPDFNDKYVVNTRLINYKLDSIGKSNINSNCITINKISILDKFYNEINSKYLFPDNYKSKYSGIEDIRLFNFKSDVYFIGSYYNDKNNKVQIVSNKYNIGENYNPLIINPTFKTEFNWEKNWVFFENNDQLNIIYKWNPIYICKIDYANQNLNLIKSIENVPTIFNKFRGSTNGVKYNDKFWFIVHQQNNIIYDIKGYLHNFVVFDKNMNLLGYSKAFNFENSVVEFCIGFELSHKNKFIITYSTLDSTTKLAVFSPEYINSLIDYF
jgi:hypothetical protein